MICRRVKGHKVYFSSSILQPVERFLNPRSLSFSLVPVCFLWHKNFHLSYLGKTLPTISGNRQISVMHRHVWLLLCQLTKTGSEYALCAVSLTYQGHKRQG
ncbi:hypothetical protein XELAEV_18001726mg [Xenopus laevis]|nr:hypothetical protein XELAEV_18001726mg [Xenopus laevis]